MLLGVGDGPFDVDRGKASRTMGFERIRDEEFLRIGPGRFQPAYTVRGAKPSIASSCNGSYECMFCDRFRLGRVMLLEGVDPVAQACECVKYGGGVMAGR